MSETDCFFSVDIETDGPNIFRHNMFSIGAVCYSSDLEEQSRCSVNLQRPLMPDAETMLFWSKFPDAWKAGTDHAVSRYEGMDVFCRWVLSYPGKRRFIAYPTWFDYGWVRQYCLEYFFSDPFNRLVGDYAQQAWAAGIKVPKVKNPTPHVALADAAEQGEQFVHVMREIRKLKS